jgi:iron complex outermembrane receptor protein
MIEVKKPFQLALMASVALGALSFPAYAQGTTQPAEQEEAQQEEQQQSGERTRREDTIVVTGSLLRRDTFTSASPITVITAETATLEGLVDTAEILQTSSVAAGSTQINQTFGGFIVNGGPGIQSVGLRGLGAGRTLVLVNGHRFGPSGVEGRVSAVDLGAIPSNIVQRVEILKDGASTVYGSDAVAGVINIITRTAVDKPEIVVNASRPFEEGGARYSVSGAYGFELPGGTITASASYQYFEPLEFGQRDWSSCASDYVFDANGNLIDQLELSPLDRGANSGPKCFNSGVVNAIDVFNNTTRRFIQDPGAGADRAAGIFPGFRLRGQDGRALNGNGGTVLGPLGFNLGLQETDTDDPRLRSQHLLPEQTALNAYVTANFTLPFAEAYGEFLYNRRDTEIQRFRQFFPWVDALDNAFLRPGGNNLVLPANCQNTTTGAFTASCGGTASLARPITLIPFDTDVTIDYLAGVGGLRGEFGPEFGLLNGWSWDTYMTFSRSDGEYTRTTVDARNVEDALDARTDVRTFRDANGNIVCRRWSDNSACPVINYFDPRFVAGDWNQTERDFLLARDTGTTIYDQFLFNAFLTGDLFTLPAGDVGAAVGFEYRKFEIEDRPGPLSFGGNQWGLTSAVNTIGEDSLKEVFAEVEVPVLKGQPFAESLTLNLSGRYFDYDSFGNDTIYKVAANWQVNPLLRFRGTQGTGFRAPGLFELFLGNQTGFVGQGNIDPCINWGESNNDNLRRNCAADGIPADYAGIGSSATTISGGGAGTLSPETSEMKTFGVVITPTALDISLAVDWFSIEVENEVAQFGAANIVSACYSQPVFPNTYCQFVTRERNATLPNAFNILTVRNPFVNINQQVREGIDANIRYDKDFDFGRLTFDFEGSWSTKKLQKVFSLSAADGFDDNEFNGTIGDPDFVGNSRIQFRREDWTFTWFSDYVGKASNVQELTGGSTFTYSGLTDTRRKVTTEATFYHGASVRYQGDDFSLTAGIDNMFNEDPPAVSFNAGVNRLGTSALQGTQYDLFGRTLFVTLAKTF